VDPDVPVTITPTQVQVDGAKVTITFDSDDLNSGAYQLVIQPTVTDLGGIPLDGNGDGRGGDAYVVAASAENTFYELTSNYNGDTGVSVFDFTTFSYWFGASLPNAPAYADPSGDGGVSVFDFTAFSLNFGIGIVLPAAFAPDVFSQRDGNDNAIVNADDDVVDQRELVHRQPKLETVRGVELFDLALMDLADGERDELELALSDLFDDSDWSEIT
ncbi:MAG: hypothetical protein ACI9G1_001281, partial [Pirellulaceae bacterium]